MAGEGGEHGETAHHGPVHRAKLALLWALSGLPGASGEVFARRYHRRRRGTRIGEAVAEFHAVLAALPEGAVCVDLGANIGDVTAQMVEAGAEVYAVEADPWAFAQLSERFAGVRSVHLRHAAVWDADGTLQLSRAPDFQADPASRSIGSSVLGHPRGADGQAGVEVPALDILTLLREIGRPVALLKMDIEGAEVAVLERLLGSEEADWIETIFAETHEILMPDLRPKLRALRERVRGIARPRINLDWR